VQKSYSTIMGVALGDMMGLYYEGLSSQTIIKKRDTFTHPKLLFGHGLFSDDTQHTIIVAQCLIESKSDPQIFDRLLRKKLQRWLLTLPAGVGFATLRGIFKSFFTTKSGVFSAGNAPAMRSHLIGLHYGESDATLQAFIQANTTLTHTDPKAYYGALVVAKATYLFTIHQEDQLWEWIEHTIDDDALQELMHQTATNLEQSTKTFAKTLGLEQGVSGYIYHTLPIALHAAFSNRDNYQQAIIDVIECGGDTDTVAAIAGGIIGTRVSKLPQEWIESIVDYPITTSFIQALSMQLETMESNTQKALSLPWVFEFLRNTIFLIIVLISAMRRVF